MKDFKRKSIGEKLIQGFGAAPPRNTHPDYIQTEDLPSFEIDPKTAQKLSKAPINLNNQPMMM